VKGYVHKTQSDRTLHKQDCGSYMHRAALLKRSPGTAVKLLPCDHKVMGSSLGNSLLLKCKERPKVIGPFLGLCASESYVHHDAFFRHVALKFVQLFRKKTSPKHFISSLPQLAWD
jgi:hypothetical protein